MATVPGQLIWEIVKKNNCFLVKQFGRGTASLRFSKESNNLYNLNSYKHSGTLCVCVWVCVRARACLSVSLTLSWLMFSLKGLCARFCLI
jgi:hypothetical protein